MLLVGCQRKAINVDDDGEDYQEPVDDLAELDEDVIRDRLSDTV